ncbi:MAG TPA: ABC transporter ATP-binding protein [Clostridia bacterium]|nr:ABC transporter ATP-binding protein [Clostridia bacterium]
MLEVEGLNVYYGGIHAVKGVSLKVPDGKIITLVGANGAGKSSILRSIVGLVKPKSGSIKFKGTELVGRLTNKIVESGVVLVPEGRRVFADFTVLENLKAGAYSRTDKQKIEEDLEWVFSLFPRLKERIKQRAGLLSGGEQQMLAVGRALMSRPDLLMMDEPSLGLAPQLAEGIFRIIGEINAKGKTVLLVEQNAKRALELSDYAYVLETGRIVLEGLGTDLMKDERVRKAYLGE